MTPSGSPDEANRVRARPSRRWSTLVGIAVGLAGTAFVVAALARNWSEVSGALAGANPLLLLVALLAAVAGMTGIGLAWHASLRLLGSGLPLLSSLRGFFLGQLGKYVPGGIWAIVGQGEWARSGGVSGAVAYTSVVFSVGAVYLAALIVAAVLAPASGLLRPGGSASLALLILLPLGFAAVHPRVIRRVLTTLHRMTGREVAVVVPPWRNSSALVLQQLPTWLVIGASSVAIAASLGHTAEPFNVASATVVAWIAGFVALPTPAGLGVREAVFVTLATSLPTGIAATVAVVSRLAFIVADAAAAGIVTAVAVRRTRHANARA